MHNESPHEFPVSGNYKYSYSINYSTITGIVFIGIKQRFNTLHQHQACPHSKSWQFRYSRSISGMPTIQVYH